MKKILLSTAILFSAFFVNAQVTIFSDNFESGSSNWMLNPAASGGNEWIVNNEYDGQGIFTDTPDQSSGVTGNIHSYYLHITSQTVACGGLGICNANFYAGDVSTNYAMMASNISTTGYSSVSISFYYLSLGAFTGFPAFDSYGNLQYSINGVSGPWITVGSNYVNQGSWTTVSVSNAAFDNQATLRFRFKWADGITGNDPPFSVDQVVISGFLASTVITAGTISPLSYCQGAAVSVPFTITGTFSGGNIFTAQLSNASGSFASPVSIGTFSGTASGTINATIPLGTTPGAGYRIRVVSSNPVITGTANVSNITVNVNPTVNAGSAQTVCPGTSVTLTASGASSFSWMPGSLSGTPVSVAPAVATTYTVTGTTSGCSGTATVTISMLGEPSVTAFGNPMAICLGATTTLSGTGALTYSWMPGSMTGGLISVAPTGTTTYTLTGTNTAGCTHSSTVTITVNANPAVTLNAFNPDTVCTQHAPIILAGGTPAGGTYAGTGVSAGSFIPGVSVLGLNNIIYTFTDANTCKGSDTSSIFVEICNGINDPGETTSVEMFPNPSSGNITLKFNHFSEQIQLFSVINILGEIVYKGSIDSSNPNSERTLFLKPGIYFIKIGEGNYEPKKIIIY